MHHLDLKGQNFENPVFTFRCFSLEAVCSSCKLQSFFTYSFTHTTIVFLFKYLPTGNVIFINVYYQIKCFSGDSFSFLLATLYAPEISLFKVFMNASKLTGEMPIDRSFFLSI